MKNKDIIIGIIVGLIASSIGLLLVLLFFGKGNSVSHSLHVAINNNVFAKLVSMGALLNLAAFFLFIKTKKDAKAKGVLIATVVVAIITIIVKFV
ncbi:hypothetical protein A9Q86_00970 [Flavobacteriales bacterium 33_180_T64]|nr:hypothetical protein A9Q86_00970 [Flavobacteriales bacterium 33_180_T64]